MHIYYCIYNIYIHLMTQQINKYMADLNKEKKKTKKLINI